jgi:hypothetical protein
MLPKTHLGSCCIGKQQDVSVLLGEQHQTHLVWANGQSGEKEASNAFELLYATSGSAMRGSVLKIRYYI